MNNQLIQKIKDHALQEMPRECCGLLVMVKRKLKYFPCRNIAEGHEHFVIHPEDYAAAEAFVEVVRQPHCGPQRRRGRHDAHC